MNWFDAVVLALAMIGGLIGFRIGFVVRALSWLGLAIGLTIGLRLAPRLATALAASTPGIRLLAVASLLIGLSLIGHTAGIMASHAMRTKLSMPEQVSGADRLTGGVLGALGVFMLVWLLAPALRSTPGWPARAARGSSLVALVEERGPRPPRAARILGQLVSAAPAPLVDSPGDFGSPPGTDAGPLVDTATARAVVLVEGSACGFRLDGTGFTFRRELVMTNAHVVAGVRAPSVVTVSGERLPARVVQFDPRHDIAVLRVPGLEVPRLRLGPVRVGTVASVLGHPNGGELRATPALVARRIDIARSDITRTGTIETSIVGLAARLIVGDSGAPVVGTDGRVQAMVFAVDPANDRAAFALGSDELAPYAARARRSGRGVDTGTCLTD